MNFPSNLSSEQKAEMMRENFQSMADPKPQQEVDQTAKVEHPKVPTMELRPDGVRSADAIAAASGGYSVSGAAQDEQKRTIDLQANFQNAHGTAQEIFRDKQVSDEIELDQEACQERSR